jgi:hypothetical protein
MTTAWLPPDRHRPNLADAGANMPAALALLTGADSLLTGAIHPTGRSCQPPADDRREHPADDRREHSDEIRASRSIGT